MATNVSEVLLKLKLDKSEAKQAERGVESLREELEQLTRDTNNLTDASTEQLQRYSQIIKESKKYEQQISKVSAATDEAKDDVEALNRSMQKLNQTVQSTQTERYETSLRSARERVDPLGDIDTGLAAGGGLVNAVAGSGAGEALMLGSDILAVTEAAPKAGVALKSVTDRMIEGSAAASGLAAAAAAAKTQMAGSALTAASVAVAFAPIAIMGTAIAAVGLALHAFNRSLNESKKAVGEAADANETYHRTLAGNDMSTEDAQARLEELERLAAAEQAILDDNAQAIDGAFRSAQDAYGDGAARLMFLVGNVEGSVSESTEEAKENLAGYRSEMAALNALLESGETEAVDMAAAEEELAAARQRSEQTLMQLQKQRDQLTAGAAQQNRYQSEDRSVAARRSEEDYQEQREKSLSSHLKSLQSAQEAHDNRMAGLQANYNKSVSKMAQDLTKANANALSKLNKDVEKLATNLRQQQAEETEDYRKSQRALSDKYQKDQMKQERQFAKQRLRQKEDLENDIFQAELSNDILSLTLSKRRGEQSLSRMDEDRADEKALATEQYQDERQQAKVQHEERMSDMREDAVARRAEMMAQYEEQKLQRQTQHQERLSEMGVQLAEQLALEAANHEKSKAQSIKAFQESEAQAEAARQKQLKRLAEDQERQDKRAAEQLEKQLSDIDTKIEAEQQAVQGMIDTVGQAAVEGNNAVQGEIQRGVQNTINTASGAFATLASNIAASAASSGGRSRSRQPERIRESSGTRSSSRPRGGGSRAYKFAEGGLVKRGREAVGYFEPERKYDEAVLPLTPRVLSGLMPQQAAAPNVNVTVNGDGVSVGDVRQAVMTAFREFNRGLSGAMYGGNA